MRALCNEEFLGLWESGRRLHALDRALLAIQTSAPVIPPLVMPAIGTNTECSDPL